MEKERLNVLLLNAISMLIDEGITNEDIKTEIGASQEEWEELMESF